MPSNLGYEVVESRDESGNYDYVLRGQDKKLEPLIVSTANILRRSRASALKVSRLVGSWTWLCLLNRPLLSIFATCYNFVNENWHRKHEAVPLWDSVASEFQALLGCLPFLQANLSLSWSDIVYEADAGPNLCPVIRSKRNVTSQEELRTLGCRAERGGWLIQPEMTSSPVADLLERRLVDFDEDSGEFRSLRPTQPAEIPEKWFDPKRWRLVFNAPAVPGQHNTPSEVRCVALAVMHAIKNYDAHWDKRFLLFSDAGAAIGAFAKGRSTSEECNHYCRQAACCLFLANIRLYLRWVGSAHNCADGPSRGMSRPGVAPATVSKAQAARAKVWADACGREDAEAGEALSADDSEAGESRGSSLGLGGRERLAAASSF